MIRIETSRASVAGRSGSAGFTVIELLVSSAIFILILGAVGSLLTSSLRAYTVTNARSEAIQDSEAVLQLIRYEVAMAGYRGIGEGTYTRPFTLGGTDTVRIETTPDGDELTVRYFEDRFIAGTDNGERRVTFRVDGATDTLVRQELRPLGGSATTELLVGNIVSMEVFQIIDRDREPYEVEALRGGAAGPDEVAGLNIRLQFSDGLLWEFLVGVSNPQQYVVD